MELMKVLPSQNSYVVKLSNLLRGEKKKARIYRFDVIFKSSRCKICLAPTSVSSLLLRLSACTFSERVVEPGLF